MRAERRRNNAEQCKSLRSYLFGGGRAKRALDGCFRRRREKVGAALVAALHPNATKEERGGAGAHEGRPYQIRNPARFPAPGTLREFEFHECTDLRGRVKRKFAKLHGARAGSNLSVESPGTPAQHCHCRPCACDLEYGSTVPINRDGRDTRAVTPVFAG